MTYRAIQPIVGFDDTRQSVTALAFDPVSDALWSGYNNGAIVAYYGSDRPARGVSFPVGGKQAVSKIVVGESYVRAVGLRSGGVGTWGKGGANKWFYKYKTPGGQNTLNGASNVTTFSAESSANSEIALSTTSPEIVFVNALTGIEARRIATTSMITHLLFSHSTLVSGAFDGCVRLHDPRTGLRKDSKGGSNATIKAHNGSIQGIQSAGNYLYTIGYGVRQSRPIPDPLVKVYDLRTMQALSPISFNSGPAFIHPVPRKPSHLAVISSLGLVNIVDINNPGAANEFYQLDLASHLMLTSTAISPTGAYMAFGDTEGTVHFLTAAEEGTHLPFNGYEGQPFEWYHQPEQLPDIKWTESTPLNTIGMAYYTEPLLSSWSPHFEHNGSGKDVFYPPPPKIPRQILNAIVQKDGLAYAQLPKELRGRRNMHLASAGTKSTGRFRSGKNRSEDLSNNAGLVDSLTSEVPLLYRHVEIEYSKFGVEDFDFGFYNKTEFSGLETHILNSYTNAVVQIMHYTLPIRKLAKSHITINCPREHCMLCELGFVARMLEDAGGINCQSSNFCKTVGVLAPQANAMELVDFGRDPKKVNYSYLIQSFHRFLVDRLLVESNSAPQPLNAEDLASNSSPITQLMGLHGKTTIRCLSCGNVREKDTISHIVEMVYPRKPPVTRPKAAAEDSSTLTDFASVVRSSLLRHITYKATCPACNTATAMSSNRTLQTSDLPPLIALHTSTQRTEDMDLWRDKKGQTFLKPRVKIGGLKETEDGMKADDEAEIEYQIRAMVVQIVEKDKHSHLVAIVKVPRAEGRKDLISPWFVFNDFHVQNVSEQEALSFVGKWKLPAIVYLERVDLDSVLDFSQLPDKLDPVILQQDTSISRKRDPNLIKHKLLESSELPMPGKGTLVAIDAEFVSMQQEESEYRSDGSRKVLRPARLSLARVSVLRGEGPLERVPFIDDHIHTSETIVDYLTEYSGIKYGDLDPHTSPYTLTPLKLVYKKLRLLVDLGCIFIGHGLSKDFRIINIFVPRDQILDTVDMYYIPGRQRRLSLKFLSWFVLNERIQGDMHDSIEDAKSALMLYKKFLQYEEEGTLDKQLDELYKAGRQHQWKPPPTEDAVTAPDLSNLTLSSPQALPPFGRAYRTDVTTPPPKHSAGSIYPSSQHSSPVPYPPPNVNFFGSPTRLGRNYDNMSWRRHG